MIEEKPIILLDRNNDAIPPDGYVIIDTEVVFLEYATSSQALFIRGQRLCEWARRFYDGRKIVYKDAPSPIRNLVETFAGLTPEQAQFILPFLSENISTWERISAPAILSACYPISLWDAIPSKRHAAEWLLWLDETEPDNAFRPILKAMTDDWKQVDPELGDLYNIQDAASARDVLQKWFGASITHFLQRFGEFPVPVPEKWIEILVQSWRKEIVITKGEFLSEFLKSQTPWYFKQLVALATLDYFEKYPDSENFTIERYNQIARFVSGSNRIRLRVIKPVSAPSDMPNIPEAVLSWFEREYLPFREWQVATKAEKIYPRVLELGEQFARWYLDFYPKALTSKKHISFFKSKNLRDKASEYVYLLVILDGLHALDSKFVMDALLKANGNQRLVLIENSFCFAPLPTVTDFAKGALVHGAQPTLMKELELLGEDVSEQQTPLPKLQSSRPGSLFIWRIQEPDRTYHTNKSSMLKAHVEGELSTIAQKICGIVEKVSPSVSLRIIVTTDHGRFLGNSNRTVDIPQGMNAHGRAAWGKTNISFDKTGYKIEGDLAYLSKDRFGLLSDDAAVILTDSAFRHEKHGHEYCTHGGLFPEEVIIPWMVFGRNISKPDLEFTLSGDGGANQPGKVLISTLNSSSLDLTVVKVEMNFGTDKNFSFDLLEGVPGYKKAEFEINIPSWPSSEQLALGKSIIVIRLPSGEEFNVLPSLAKIMVSEIYTRDKTILEGLE